MCLENSAHRGAQRISLRQKNVPHFSSASGMRSLSPSFMPLPAEEKELTYKLCTYRRLISHPVLSADTNPSWGIYARGGKPCVLMVLKTFSLLSKQYIPYSIYPYIPSKCITEPRHAQNEIMSKSRTRDSFAYRVSEQSYMKAIIL